MRPSSPTVRVATTALVATVLLLTAAVPAAAQDLPVLELVIVDDADGTEVNDITQNGTGGPILHDSGFHKVLRVELQDSDGQVYPIPEPSETVTWTSDDCVALTEGAGLSTIMIVEPQSASNAETDCHVRAEFVRPVGSLSPDEALKLADRTGFVEVVGPLDKVLIEDAPGGDQTEVGDLDISADDAVPLYLAGYDAVGHNLGPTDGTWSIGAEIGDDCGVVDAGPANRTILEATTTTDPEQECRVTAVGDTASDDTGDITVTAGAPANVIVRTDADGRGTVAGDFALSAGDAETFCAAVYDEDLNYLGDEDADWFVVDNETVEPGVLIGSFDDDTATACTTFTAEKTGTGLVQASVAGVGDDTTGTVSVSPGPLDHLEIEERNETGVWVDAASVRSVSADDNATEFRAVGFDAFDNRIGVLAATWEVTNAIGTLNSTDDGDPPGFDAVTNETVTFDPVTNATGDLSAGFDVDGDGEINASRGEVVPLEITVRVGALVQLVIEDDSDGTGEEVGDLFLDVGDDVALFAIGRDADGNFNRSLKANWTVVDAGEVPCGSVSPAVNATVTVFTAEASGTCKVGAEAVEDPNWADRTGVIDVA